MADVRRCARARHSLPQFLIDPRNGVVQAGGYRCAFVIECARDCKHQLTRRFYAVDLNINKGGGFPRPVVLPDRSSCDANFTHGGLLKPRASPTVYSVWNIPSVCPVVSHNGWSELNCAKRSTRRRMT